MNIKLMLPTALLACLSLISCGGGGGDAVQTGYTGPTTPASVSTANKQSLAVTATAGASQAIAENTAINAALRPSSVSSFMLDFAGQLKNRLSRAHRTANQPVPEACTGGSADFTANQDGSLITVIFSNCTVSTLFGGSGEIVNGTVIITSDPQSLTNFTLRFVNFSVVYLGETYSINLTIVCDDSGCAWTSDFTGPDGRTYRTENAVVFSSGANTYEVTATVYDPDNGFIEISGTVIYGSCAGGVPVSGSITFAGASASTGSVTFNGCDSFSVTVDGEETVYLWADILP